MENKLQIFTAGVAMGLVRKTVEVWNAEHADFQASFQPGGSVDLVRKVVAGENCDLLITADQTLIETMLMPKYADGYCVFAGNKMAIVAAEGKDISSENWKEKLLDPAATFNHHSPYGDPGGYRAVMSILLADRVEAGLSQKLMDHPGHYGMDPNLDPRSMPKCDYSFGYYSGAASRGGAFAELPAVMDLSDDKLADVYASVEFAVDADNTVKGTPIAHGMTIPLASKHPKQARAFAQLFLQNDFAAANFQPRSGSFGNWK